MLNRRSDKMELLRIAESVANEKSIDTEIRINAMETAIKKAAKTRFGGENEIRVIIDRETGEINLHKVLTVVETPENLNSPGILIMGHMDTVHPIGTLKNFPFRIDGNKCFGPGIFDMKSGNLIAIEVL